MKSFLFATALLMTAGAAVPAFAADPVPEKPKMHHMRGMHGAKAGTMMHPAREKSTDDLNQKQLDMNKS